MAFHSNYHIHYAKILIRVSIVNYSNMYYFFLKYTTYYVSLKYCGFSLIYDLALTQCLVFLSPLPFPRLQLTTTKLCFYEANAFKGALVVSASQ